MNSLFFILKLYRSKNVGNVSFKYLIAKYGNAENALKNLENNLEYTKIKIAQDDVINEEIEKTYAIGANFLTYNDFPKNLYFYYDFPPVIIYQGDISLLNTKILGVVGSRNPTINGIRFTKEIVLYMENYTIISGFARGIDQTAHEYAKKTIAVFAGGIDQIYPPNSIFLYEKIKKDGLIITDMPIGTQVTSYLFAKRNNIISMIADQIVITEASLKSGALYTAKSAFLHKKPLFLVPGNPYDPNYAGNLKLLQEKKGEILISVDQLKDTSFHENNFQFKNHVIIDIDMNNKQKVLSSIGFSVTNVELIGEYTKISIGELLAIISELELEGKIKIINTYEIYRIK